MTTEPKFLLTGTEGEIETEIAIVTGIGIGTETKETGMMVGDEIDMITEIEVEIQVVRSKP